MLKDSSGSQIVKDGATPGRPVEVIGLKGTPNAGDELLVVANDERAQKISRSRSIRTQQIRNTSQITNIDKSDSSDTEEVSGPTTIPVVIKADVQGSAEAVRDSISSLSNEHVIINIIHTGVGPITSSDIALAIPFGGHVIGFNVKTASDAEAIAKQHSVGIRSRRIIYELIEDVENMIQGAVPKPLEEVSIGNAQVLALFKIPGKRGKPDRVIAGCRVLDGVIKSTMKIRVMRSGEIVFEAPVESLRRHKLDVETVGKGTECGVGLQGFQDFMVGDSLSCIDLQ
jgi:translation initiation factor IF-2